jgi:trimethylamine:corrinoid methyltransferase-like protein
MRLKAQVLSQSECERIHAHSLRIVSEVGVRFHGEIAPQVRWSTVGGGHPDGAHPCGGCRAGIKDDA